MRLSDLAGGYEVFQPSGVSMVSDPGITGITEDSRRVTPGMLFVAVRGTADDGRRYVGDALQRGAAAIAAEELPAPVPVPFLRVRSGRTALAMLAARFFDHPDRALTLIGFTGTFGKTSTSAILRELLEAGGARAGVLGSLGARYADFHDPGTGLTTPAPVELYRALRGLRSAGADTVIMEVTSHALRLERTHGLRFAGGLLAAIMPGEHTDFHRSYGDYVQAKRLFLDHLCSGATLAFDADNDASRLLAGEAQVARRAGFSVYDSLAELPLKNVTLDHRGVRFTVHGQRFRSPLLGRGHLKNVALALAYASAAGIALDAARGVIERLRPLPRRMERYEADGRAVLDDTAGHPDSLQATFEVAAMLKRVPEMQTSRTVIVHALRGSRGVDINQGNARALADLASEHGVSRLIVTASADVAGPHDRATDEEVDAARKAFAARGQPILWFDALADAAHAAMDDTSAGDLIVLTGAQGMNEGKRLLHEGHGGRRT